jgi:hypothetical protein
MRHLSHSLVRVPADWKVLGSDFRCREAIAIGFIAWFTLTIRQVNQTQLKHLREVERAYLVGGGPIAHTDPYKFIMDVANYGKTPASMKQFAVEVCDLKDIPKKPKYLTPGYKRETRIDEFAPTQKKSIATMDIPKELEKPIVYGRFWYYDLWREEERYFSFILRVGTREEWGLGLATHPDLGLIGIDPEYTKWT